MEENDRIIVQKEETHLRIDKLLACRFGEKSRTYFQYLIEEKKVLVNQKPVKKKDKVKEGDEIEIYFIATEQTPIEPEDIPLDILFEDEHLIVINKSANMVVHPACGNWKGTIVNALLHYTKNLPQTHKEDIRPGIVHRLDKDTTGILVAAKTQKMQQGLIELFSQRKIHKKYLAICFGKTPTTTLSLPIGRHFTKRKEMTVQHSGKMAISEIENITFCPPFSLVKVSLHTGRTHQIRVHLQHINTPIVGDPLYGNKFINKKYTIDTQLLHAYQMQFIHPITNKMIDLTAPLPQKMQDFLKKFLNISSL